MAVACLAGGPRDFYFRTDPSEISWGYSMNTSVQPTYGGQVIQLLSVSIDTLTVVAEVGKGGDEYFNKIVTYLRDLGEWQKDTNEPVTFLYAPRNINLKVYFKGINIAKTRSDLAGKLTMSFDCASDTTGTITQIAMGDAMARIHDGMGYEEASDADQAQIDAITADRKKKNTLMTVQGASGASSGGTGNSSDTSSTAPADPNGGHQDWMAAAGISSSDYGDCEILIQRESSWNPEAVNASSGACGLVQALPCSKLGPNWKDPVVALKWGDQYVKERYGGWGPALQFHYAHNWY